MVHRNASCIPATSQTGKALDVLIILIGHTDSNNMNETRNEF